MTRAQQIDQFLQDAGWKIAERQPVPGDASTRRYVRLTMDGKAAVLMDAPKGAESPSEPDGASVEDRRKLGYNALARLAGPNPESFAAIASELKTRGFSAPQIIAADLEAGLMLLEDLGDNLFARVIESDVSLERPLYEAAIDTLAAIYRSSFPLKFTHGTDVWRVREYDTAALQAEADLFLEWFVTDLGVDLSDKAITEWYKIWGDMFTALEAHAPGLALRDFHAENLFWLPERQATARVGLIDFQDALLAHPAYDLVSLLEDARRAVSAEVSAAVIPRFCDKAGLADDQAFRNAYAVMGAQRNAKILGIFVRLAKRDNKVRYRELIPRVVRLFINNLQSDTTSHLKDWMECYLPQIFDIRSVIKTAMVMAAGHGTRMRPLTNDRSKAMVEVDGKPLIDHMLDRLAEVGVERVVVNVHAHADHLETHLKARQTAPEIIISDEREALLETGGGVVKALPLLGSDPIFICNIDAVWQEFGADLSLDTMLKLWDPTRMDDLLLLAPKQATLGYHGAGDFHLDKTRLKRRNGDSAPFIYAGVQIARLEPVRGFDIKPFSRNEIWNQSLALGRAHGIVMDGFWMHVGDPAARDEAEARLKAARE